MLTRDLKRLLPVVGLERQVALRFQKVVKELHVQLASSTIRTVFGIKMILYNSTRLGGVRRGKSKGPSNNAASF